jgi:hypothetical protein
MWYFIHGIYPKRRLKPPESVLIEVRSEAEALEHLRTLPWHDNSDIDIYVFDLAGQPDPIYLKRTLAELSDDDANVEVVASDLSRRVQSIKGLWDVLGASRSRTFKRNLRLAKDALDMIDEGGVLRLKVTNEQRQELVDTGFTVLAVHQPTDEAPADPKAL